MEKKSLGRISHEFRKKLSLGMTFCAKSSHRISIEFYIFLTLPIDAVFNHLIYLKVTEALKKTVAP